MSPEVLFLNRPIYKSILKPELIELPEYSPYDNPKKVYKYIYPCSGRAKGKWAIIKKINEKDEYFGHFETLVDAITERDILIKCEWDVEVACQYPPQKPRIDSEDLPPFPGKRNKGSFGFIGATYRNRHGNPEYRVWSTQIYHNKHVKTLGCFEDPLSASLVNRIVKKEINQHEGVKVSEN